MRIIIGTTQRNDYVNYTVHDQALVELLGNGECEEIIVENTLHKLQHEAAVKLLYTLCNKLCNGGIISLEINDWYELSSQFAHNLIDTLTMSKIVDTSFSVFTQSEIATLLANNNIKIDRVNHEIDGYRTHIRGIKNLG